MRLVHVQRLPQFSQRPIDITLADPDGRFSQEWSFDIAGTITITLEQDNWHNPSEKLQIVTR